MGPYHILLDCGVEQIASLQEIPQKLDLAWCSHAHPDHARGLLALRQVAPELPIYTSEVTAQLLPLNWLGAAENASELHCQSLDWRSLIELRPGLSGTIIPAGHLPGAAMLLLTYTPLEPTSEERSSYTLLYTGDFCLSNFRMVEGLPLEEIRGLRPDVLILEGSYGTARFPRRRQQENQLAERISRAISDGLSVLLPVSPLGLGQEMLVLLRSHHLFTGRDVDIWVDDSVASGCDVYLQLLPDLPASVQNFARHQALFWDERIRPRVRRLSSRLSSLNARPTEERLPPCILLADINSHWQDYYAWPHRPWLVLLPEHPGYSSPKLTFSVIQPSQNHLETYLLAEHCDESGTTQLIHNLRPQHVIFVHGCPTYLADLAGLDELSSRYHLHTPAVGRLVELPIGEAFYRPAAPEAIYGGELTATDDWITITLPNVITTDPRWQKFADTGLLSARWQGDELMLRGLSQQDVLWGSERFSGSQPDELSQRPACRNCRHYRSQQCWNEASSLYSLKVTPDGYCPAYQPAFLEESSGPVD
jgi:Cft2 family RNA processing exonuclease